MQLYLICNVTEESEKITAIGIEYEKEVDAARLSMGCFQIAGFTITNVYTNHMPALRGDSKQECGKYIILEVDHSKDEVKTLPREWEVKDRKHFEFQMEQKKAVYYKDGTICTPFSETIERAIYVDEDFDKFTLASYIDQKTKVKLAFALYVPEDYKQTEKYPLVIYWHGGGEKGDNNLKNLLFSPNAVMWANNEEQKKHPCFVLSPQCPIDGDWIDPDTYETTEVFETVCNLFEIILSKYSIDMSRVYCTGFSMGGMGAWEATKRYYKLFAATLIFAGQDNYEGLELLKDNKIWVFHGEDDDKAMPGNVDNMETFEAAGVRVNRAYWNASIRGEEASRLAREQLKSGGNILHTQYIEGTSKGYPHEVGWAPAITNEVVRDWVFAQENPNYSLEQGITEVKGVIVPQKVNWEFSGNEVRQLAAGNRHNVCLLKDGSVWAWGFNCAGQVGNGNQGANSDVKKPVQVLGLKEAGAGKIVGVAAGNNFSLVVDEKGEVYGWGSNMCGQLAQNDTSLRYMKPVKLEGLKDIVYVDAGDNYGVALARDGRVYTWGTNINGQLGQGEYQSSKSPVCVKDEEDPSGYLRGITKIVAGVRTIAAIKEDKTIRLWGDGEYGQIGKGVAMHGPGTTLPYKSKDKDSKTGYVQDVIEIAEGRCFTAIIEEDGNVYAWGLNRHGEIGVGDYKPKVEGEVSSDFLTTFPNPVQINEIQHAKKITAGMNHTVVLTEEGNVYTWGYNKLMGTGVLGIGESDGSNTPVQVKILSDIENIVTGFNHNFAIAKDGSIYAWGNANNGRLGL